MEEKKSSKKEVEKLGSIQTTERSLLLSKYIFFLQ